MNRKDKRYFNLAKAVSYTSDYPRVHIGSVIIKNKEILAVSANQKKSHPLQQKLNPIRFDNHTSQQDIDKCNNYQHAEFSAIIKCKHLDLNGATIYVYREDKYGNLAMCCPCKACLKLIKEVGIKVIYYTSTDGFNRLELV
jgi:deoxycytidylate deaminase